MQRVPVTESQGRIHTSSATVTVLPEAEEVDIHIDPNDLKIDVYRSTGPGGQSVNTTDSAVRITHLPTGMVVAMQDEKSQIQNRAKALQVLRARLLKAEQDRQSAELSEARRGQVGGGGRSEKIRTYNYKENRVTDHRIGLTIYNLNRVLLGDLDELDRGAAWPTSGPASSRASRDGGAPAAEVTGRAATRARPGATSWTGPGPALADGGRRRGGWSSRRRAYDRAELVVNLDAPAPARARRLRRRRWWPGGRRGSRCSTSSASGASAASTCWSTGGC